MVDHRVLCSRAYDCRWWTSCRKSSSYSSHSLLLPSRLSKRPRPLLRTPSRSERRSGLRSWRNSWWKCRCPPSPRVPPRQPSLRRRSGHSPGMPRFARVSTSVDHVGPTGGCRVRATSSGAHRRGSQPVHKYWAQVTSLRPCLTSSSSLHRTVDGASLQFIDSAVDIAVMQQRQVRTVSNCAFLDWLWTCPSLCMSRSSTTLSWRRGRFPWSSSADH